MWSPAGDRIAFVKGAFTAAEVWTMNPDGTRPDPDHDQLLPRRAAELAAGSPGYPRPRPGRQVHLLPGAGIHGPARTRTARTGRRSRIRRATRPSQTSPIPHRRAPPMPTESRPRLTGSVQDDTVIRATPPHLRTRRTCRVKIRVRDVLRRSDLTDYAGRCGRQSTVRVTDKNNPHRAAAPGPERAPSRVGCTVLCRTTADTTIGATACWRPRPTR